MKYCHVCLAAHDENHGVTSGHIEWQLQESELSVRQPPWHANTCAFDGLGQTVRSYTQLPFTNGQLHTSQADPFQGWRRKHDKDQNFLLTVHFYLLKVSFQWNYRKLNDGLGTFKSTDRSSGLKMCSSKSLFYLNTYVCIWYCVTILWYFEVTIWECSFGSTFPKLTKYITLYYFLCLHKVDFMSCSDVSNSVVKINMKTAALQASKLSSTG